MSASRRGLLAELGRRKVFHVAAVYAVVAWLVIQIAVATFPHLGLPAWLITAVIMLAALGLPLALVLAWAFELTPDGVRRTETPAGAASPRLTPSRAGAYVGLGMLLALVLVGAYATLRPAAERPDAAPIGSIAVLPFVDMSAAGDQEYFGDGIAEELIDVLVGVDGLRVAARTSSFAYKGRSIDARTIARELGVDAVLEGSVRKDGNRLRITAQLVDGRGGHHLWSERYDREMVGIFSIQEELGRAIADALQVRLGSRAGERLARRPTGDVDAYEAYLRGRHALRGGDRAATEAAIAHFRRALEHDSTFALAHAALATAHIALAEFVTPSDVLPMAREAAMRALEHGPDLVETHIALADVRLRYEWDWAAAERAYRRAIELDPLSAEAHRGYATYLQNARRFDDALRELRRALAIERTEAIDTIAFRVRELTEIGFLHHWAGNHARAEAHLREAVRLGPDQILPHHRLGLALLAQGRNAEAVVELERVRALAGDALPYLSHLGVAYARAGRTAQARAILAELARRAERAYVPKDQLAYLHYALGEEERALHWLERTFEERHWWAPEINAVPLWDRLRPDPRFQAILRRLGAPPRP